MKQYVYCVVAMQIVCAYAASSSNQSFNNHAPSSQKTPSSSHKVFQKVQYTTDDYFQFKVMQKTAQRYIKEVKKANESISKSKYPQKLHFITDTRGRDPVDDERYSLVSGLLFNPSKCIFYSRLGKWRFAKDYLRKSYRPISGQKTPWQKIYEAATVNLALKKFDDYFFEVKRDGDFLLPEVRLDKKLVMALKPKSFDMDGDKEIEEVVAQNEPSWFSLSYLKMLMYHFTFGWFGSQDDEGSIELQEQVEMETIVSSSSTAKEKKRQQFSPHKLAIWKAMSIKYEQERSQITKKNK